MKLLSLNTEILGFDTSSEFVKELNLNEKDLVLQTEEYMKEVLNL